MIWNEDEAARAVALVSTIIDGYEGGDIAATLDFLVTDVEDWEALALELAGHTATTIIVLAKLLDVEPYKLFERYVNER